MIGTATAAERVAATNVNAAMRAPAILPRSAARAIRGPRSAYSERLVDKGTRVRASRLRSQNPGQRSCCRPRATNAVKAARAVRRDYDLLKSRGRTGVGTTNDPPDATDIGARTGLRLLIERVRNLQVLIQGPMSHSRARTARLLR